jgi:hypothetical protein
MATSENGLVRNGAVAGVVGGLAIAAAGMSLSALRGTGFWSLPNGIAGIAVGPAAGATRDLGLVTLEGVVLHMVLSAVFGVVTLFIIRRLTKEYLLTAVAAGLLLWVINYYAIGSFVPGAHALAELNPVWMGGLLHALFGAVTGLTAKRLEAPVAYLTKSAA